MITSRRTFCWILIFAASAGIMIGHYSLNETVSGTDDTATMAILTLQAKFLVAGEALGAGTMRRELEKLEPAARSPGPARAQAILYGLLTGDDREAGRKKAAELLERHEDALIDPEQKRLHLLVRAAIDDPSGIAHGDREFLEVKLGWFAEIILSRDLSEDAPERKAPRRSAFRLLAFMVMLLVLAGAGVLVGCGLLILAAVRKSDGQLLLRLGKPIHEGSLYLEAFTVYIWLFFILEILPPLLGFTTPWLSFGGLAVLSLAGLFWPILRGVPGKTAFRDLGLYRGRGILKELGSGLIGYVAVLPVVAIGFAATLFLSLYSRAEPVSHPVVVWIAGGGVGLRLAVLFLASGFAPFFEETMFRGALFRDLRRFIGPILSSVLMGVLFAAVHPQGLITIPALTSLAVGFAFIREWRGSLIAPITAHAIHNGILVGFMCVAFS